MINLIIGGKGKGKTKILLDQANEAVRISHGNIVFLDKSSKHMYELNNKVRLIDISNLPLNNPERFLGALCGILSRDHDIEKIFMDNFEKIAKTEEENINGYLEECEKISDIFNVEFVIGVSVDKGVLSEKLQTAVTVEC